MVPLGTIGLSPLEAISRFSRRYHNAHIKDHHFINYFSEALNSVVAIMMTTADSDFHIKILNFLHWNQKSFQISCVKI